MLKCKFTSSFALKMLKIHFVYGIDTVFTVIFNSIASVISVFVHISEHCINSQTISHQQIAHYLFDVDSRLCCTEMHKQTNTQTSSSFWDYFQPHRKTKSIWKDLFLLFLRRKPFSIKRNCKLNFSIFLLPIFHVCLLQLTLIALNFHLQFALATTINIVNSFPSDISSPATASAAVRATTPMTIYLNSKIAAANVTTTSASIAIPLPILSSKSSAPVQINEDLSKLSSSPAIAATAANTTKSHLSQATNNNNNPITIQKKPLWQKLWPFNAKSSFATTAVEATTIAAAALPTPTKDFRTKEFKVPFSFNPSVTHQFNALFSFSKMPHKKYHHQSGEGGDSGNTENAVDVESTYDDINREQLSTFQQDQSYQNEYDGDLKVKWQRWLHSPVSAWHKVQKWGVDAAGLGPLYGTGEFKHKQHHHHGQEPFWLKGKHILLNK